MVGYSNHTFDEIVLCEPTLVPVLSHTLLCRLSALLTWAGRVFIAIQLLNGDLETRRPSNSFPTVLCRSELAHHFFLFEKRNRARQRLFNLHMCDCVIVCSCSCFRHAWVTRARPCLSARIVPGTTGNTSTHLILPAPTWERPYISDLQVWTLFRFVRSTYES